MRVSYNWLNSYFDNKLPSPEVIAEKITAHSYQVESIEAFTAPSGAKDFVLDIDVLPNRGSDSLCHLGIARELAVLLDLTMIDPSLEVFSKDDSSVRTADHVSLSVSDTACRRAMKRLVVDVSVGPSPAWLVDRLAALGQRSINNVVDITNYVMWETGQPAHAFDFDKLTGEKKEICIRGATPGEKIELLDEASFELSPGMLVIADKEKALDIAGVKGGRYTGIDSKTTRVLLSACNFDGRNIRCTSRALAFRSDASKHFEQGLSPELPQRAMNRMSALMNELAQGKVSADTLDYYPKKQQSYKLSTTIANINRVIGTTLHESAVEDTLRRFSEHAHWDWKKEGGRYIATVPYERMDLQKPEDRDDPYAGGVEEDLVEEIARIYGYENVPSTIPPVLPRPQILPLFYWSERLRSLLVEKGFSELTTYIFVEKGSEHAVRLDNPFAETKQYLRTTIAPQLLERLEFNKGNKDLLGLLQVKIFEIGHVFTEGSERVHCAIALESIGKKHDAHFEAESVVLDLQKTLSLPFIRYELLKETLHGVLEFDLEDLVAMLPAPEAGDLPPPQKEVTTRYQSFSIYPFISRDIAVWTEGDKEELAELLRKEGGELLVRFDLFDEFTKDGKTSYAYRIVFQSMERTLTSEEVDAIMSRIYTAVKSRGWAVR